MQRSVRIALVLGAIVVPIVAACSKEQQQPAQQPTTQQQYTGYPQQTAYPNQQYTNQQVPQATTGYPAQTATPVTTQPNIFGIPIPSNLPALIPSGMFPVFPAPTST